MSEETKVNLSKGAVAPGEQGYQVPAAAVPLPSQGLLYPPNHPLANSPTVDIKPMTAVEEDILTSKALIKSGRVIDHLLKSCVLNRSVDVDSLFAGDRNAILVAIRITGYGEKYSTEVACPSCEHKFTATFSLSQLPLKPLGAAPVEPNVNKFAFTLPLSRQTVYFKLLTGADEAELNVLLERTRKASGGVVESLVTTRLAKQILSFGSATDPNEISKMIRNMAAGDSRALRRHVSEISPDIDMRQTLECPSCGVSSEMEVPLGVEFFWPST